MSKQEKLQNRREFMSTVGKVAAGATAFSVASPFLKTGIGFAEATVEAPAYPLTYKKIDPAAAKERAYKSFYEFGGCAAGAFEGIMGSLADEAGYPYNQFPAKMYANGAAGYGMGSLCGSLGGCLAAIGLFVEAADARAIAGEVHGWYAKHEFPAYDPEDLNKDSEKTVAKSVNCADSVTKFMQANDIAEMKDPKRLARCASVTAEAVEKTVELLNAHFGL